MNPVTTKCYLVPIQSFSDIITNSSSETYIVDTSYTAKALAEALEEIHRQNKDFEHFSGECCGIEVCDFKEYCDDYLGDFDMEEECDEYGVPFISKEDYISWMFEIPLSLAKGCLVVRIDYGYGCVDEFLNNNFKCIASDHGRGKASDGRIVKY